MLLTNCAGMQSAGIRDNIQAMNQACRQQMQADRELDPIRGKVQLMRSTMEGAPPPGILANHSKPTAEEKATITKWATLREECVQGAIRYSQSLSLPPNQIPARDKYVLLLRKVNEQSGLLIAALYEGRLTYSEFATERMRVSDQFVAAVSGTPSLGQASEQVMPGEGDPPSRAAANGPELRDGDEVTLQRRGNSYLVPVAVNGLPPMPFVLDSGSDVVALPGEIVFTLWRTGTLQSTDFIGNEIYRLADGRELPSLSFKIRELKVGQHVIRNVVGSLSSFGADPLLGGSFLSQFAQWRIDNQRHLLILAEAGTELNR
jgi:hypothetical protein